MKKNFILLFVIVLTISCKISLTEFSAPDTTETYSNITINFSGIAEDNGDSIKEYGLILQIPENWNVISAIIRIDKEYKLNNQEAYESLYSPEQGYKVWAGTYFVPVSKPGNRTIYSTIQLSVGDFSGNIGDIKNYLLKAIIGSCKENGWSSDAPAEKYGFSEVIDDLYVEQISVQKKIPDEPEKIASLKAIDLLTGHDILLDWSQYKERNIQSYKIYQSFEYFSDTSGFSPLIEISSEKDSYRISDLKSSVAYFFGVAPVNAMSNENTHLTPVFITLQKRPSINGKVTSDNAPVNEILVYAIDRVTNKIVDSAKTDNEGFYNFKYLPVGSYVLQINAIGTAYLSEYYQDTQDYNLATIVEINSEMVDQEINFTIEKANFIDIEPKAYAGLDIVVNEGDIVNLNGYEFSVGDNLTYTWEQKSGTSVNLSNDNVINPTFQAPFVNSGGEQLSFLFNVIDSNGKISNDDINVFISNVVMSGDIDDDKMLNLKDIIYALQVCSGFYLENIVPKEADTNNDGAIGLLDIIYIFKELSD